MPTSVSSQAPSCDTRRLGFFHSAEATAGPVDIIAIWSHDLIATTLSKIFTLVESHLSDQVVDRMRRRGKKLKSKRTVNMSFSELVQRIVQKR